MEYKAKRERDIEKKEREQHKSIDELIKHYKEVTQITDEKRREKYEEEEGTFFGNVFNIFSPRGTKVLCFKIFCRYPPALEYSEKYLEYGEIYTIKATYPFDSFTIVELEEIPNVYFSSICFAEVEKIKENNRWDEFKKKIERNKRENEGNVND